MKTKPRSHTPRRMAWVTRLSRMVRFGGVLHPHSLKDTGQCIRKRRPECQYVDHFALGPILSPSFTNHAVGPQLAPRSCPRYDSYCSFGQASRTLGSSYA